jgi:hypothetical protein
MSSYELNFEVCCLTTLSTAVIIQRPSQINEKRMEQWWNEIDGGKPKYSEKSPSTATPFTTNPTPIGQGLNNELKYTLSQEVCEISDPHNCVC